MRLSERLAIAATARRWTHNPVDDRISSVENKDEPRTCISSTAGVYFQRHIAAKTRPFQQPDHVHLQYIREHKGNLHLADGTVSGKGPFDATLPNPNWFSSFLYVTSTTVVVFYPLASSVSNPIDYWRNMSVTNLKTFGGKTETIDGVTRAVCKCMCVVYVPCFKCFYWTDARVKSNVQGFVFPPQKLSLSNTRPHWELRDFAGRVEWNGAKLLSNKREKNSQKKVVEEQE